MKNPENDRYARQTMLAEIGYAGQERLARATVLIVGVGGLGSIVAPYLAGAGVGRLILADPDVVSVTNLQRQILYTEAETALPKTVCAARRLRAVNSTIQVDLCPEGLTPENADALISKCDLVVDCCDNFATRILIDEMCSRLGRPWVYGSVCEFVGQVSVFNYRRGIRYGDLFPDIDILAAGQRRIFGVVGPVPGAVGSLEAMECLKIITGAGSVAEGRLLTIDFLNLTTETFEF